MTAVQYFKAVRPDGTDFRTGTIDYGAALLSGDVVRHPSVKQRIGDAGTYLSVSTSATDCTGFRWPCRLLVVKPVGRALKARADYPNKRRLSALRVVGELPAYEVFGPQGEAVVALIVRAGRLTLSEGKRLEAAWYSVKDSVRDERYAERDTAWGSAWVSRLAAGGAAWHTAGDTAWTARGCTRSTWYAAKYAALALVVRDLISVEHFNALYGPWASVIDDPS